MKDILLLLFDRFGALASVEPLLALFLGAALLAVFLTAVFAPPHPPGPPGGGFNLGWTLYRQAAKVVWAALLVLFLATVVGVTRTYLRQNLEIFQGNHGRVTRANYNAVQTIWGSEQQQADLKVDIYHNEEITERVELDDPAKPAILHQKTVKVSAAGNPYLAENHVVALQQNPRKKGSAVYDGYETNCAFSWKLRNPTDLAQNCTITFPLPAAQAVYHDLTATLNGVDVLPNMQIKDASVVLALNLRPGETFDFRLAFKSRGLAYWYFQVPEPRELRDFTLTVNLADLPAAKLNYPDGCMTPTAVKPLAGGQGVSLTYHLDHALSNKGMGIAFPQLAQPGAVTRAVLNETERAWILSVAVLAIGLTLAGVRQAVVLTVLFSASTAIGYGLLADFSDLLFGFWGTAAIILLPLFLICAWILCKVGGGAGRMLAVELVLAGLIYPCAAGMDSDRQSLYMNLYGLLLLCTNSWLLYQRLEQKLPDPPPRSLASPTQFS